VDQKEAGLSQTQLDLDHTVIYAPVDGIVISRQVDVGQTVAASLQAPTLFTIAKDLTKMQIETSVDEADIGRVRVDGPATFSVDAFPGETFTGRIAQIRKAAQIVQSVVTYTVIVAVDNPERKLLPGMTANVKLIVAEKSNVLKIPNAALRFRPSGADGGTASASSPKPSAQRADSSQSLKNLRERLVRDVGVTAEQQAKLETILEDSRQQMKAIRASELADQERKAQVKKSREATRARIRDLLTPEQRAKYDTLVADEGGGGVSGRAWVLDADGQLEPVALALGLTNGSETEVLGGDIKEGQQVAVGPGGGPGGSKPNRSGASPRLRR
jgi:HlyD family secretion protein